jgi:hypothetical protein
MTMSETFGPHAGDSPAHSVQQIPRDPRSFARMLIANLGERATSYAMHQALKARQRGDDRNAERWNWIAGATSEILRSEPNDGEERA